VIANKNKNKNKNKKAIKKASKKREDDSDADGSESDDEDELEDIKGGRTARLAELTKKHKKLSPESDFVCEEFLKVRHAY
jgi:hypothetical protein